MSMLGVTRDDLILVTGATGKQGKAVATSLLENGWRVRALVRDRGKALELTHMGAEIFVGDLDDFASIDKAMEGAKGVFSVQNFWEAGYEREILQGKALAESAAKHQVRHFIYSSVQSAGRKTGIPHFESKWQIEDCIRQLNLPYTILRPVFFMENFLYPDFRKSLDAGVLPMEMKPNTPLQMVHVDHVGDFARYCFDRQRIGEEIDLASDELTMLQVAESFSKVLGRPVKFVSISLEESERVRGKEWARMYQWFNAVGYNVNIPRLKAKYGLPLMDFTTFLYRVWVPQKLLA